MRRNLLIGILFFIVVVSIFVVYFMTSQAEDLDVVMPLDDVYIHFQYARQLALGQPYVYNTGEAATSGATSFIYPYILAFGYLFGFQGLNLGIWSMMVGCVALFGAMWAIYRLCCAFGAPLWLAILTPILFALTGSVSWHAMSGMETLLIVCFTLWTLLGFVEKQLHVLVISSSLLALTRPEGSLMAGIVVLVYGIRLWFDKSTPLKLKPLIWLLLPILAIGVQPLTNYVMTGSFSASGSQAKSLLGLIPQDWSIIFTRIGENFICLWVELLTGYSPSQDISYLIILTVPLGGIGLLCLLKRHRSIVLLIALWLGSVSLAISTLDTAFWHFKRYQMPLMALFVPLSILSALWILNNRPKMRWIVYAYYGVVAPIFSIMTFSSFLELYQINENLIRHQPQAMARWLHENTPEDAIVAVHDVGMMRYVGGRNTLDIVGLTTPAATQYWRNGVGSVAEFLLEHQPDYIASYGRGHGYGLYMLTDTRLYENLLAEYSVDLDFKTNVALAADSQAIYQPDWESIQLDIPQDEVLLDVNVAHIGSENEADYQWKNNLQVDGFATVVYDFDLVGCDISHSQSCKVMEGARQLNGNEQFLADLSGLETSDAVILRSKVHPSHPISIDIYVDNNLIDTQWIPQIPGHWLDIQTRIPSEHFKSDAVIGIKPILDEGEVYVPARHQLILDTREPSMRPNTRIASYQDGHILLTDYQIAQTETDITITLDWYSDGEAVGDYRFFAHLYDEVNQPPIIQWDDYLGDSSLPIGNWLEGERQDTIRLNIESLVGGNYQLMIGFYDATTNDRLIPESKQNQPTIYDDGRLMLQDINIQ